MLAFLLPLPPAPAAAAPARIGGRARRGAGPSSTQVGAATSATRQIQPSAGTRYLAPCALDARGIRYPGPRRRCPCFARRPPPAARRPLPSRQAIPPSPTPRPGAPQQLPNSFTLLKHRTGGKRETGNRAGAVRQSMDSSASFRPITPVQSNSLPLTARPIFYPQIQHPKIHSSHKIHSSRPIHPHPQIPSTPVVIIIITRPSALPHSRARAPRLGLAHGARLRPSRGPPVPHTSASWPNVCKPTAHQPWARAPACPLPFGAPRDQTLRRAQDTSYAKRGGPSLALLLRNA